MQDVADGGEVPLINVKGAPDTIDVTRMRRYVQALVQRLSAGEMR
jgi:hypothetical protein